MQQRVSGPVLRRQRRLFAWARMQAHQDHELEDGSHAVQLGLPGGLHQCPRKQVPKKCSLLATAPTLSLDQGGPIEFLRVYTSQLLGPRSK